MTQSGLKGTNSAALNANAGGLLACAGTWTIGAIAPLEDRIGLVVMPEQELVTIDGSGIIRLDSAGAWLLQRLVGHLESSGARVNFRGFSREHEELLTLVGSISIARPVLSPARFRDYLFEKCLEYGVNLTRFLSFIGETVLVLAHSLLRPRRIRWRSMIADMYSAGYRALPIVGLLSFLMGVVVAYQGAVQLRLYGANIYIADLVGLSMARELAPLLTAILVAGRTGSSYTAQIGTMQVTEEVAALRTIGIPPMEILVLPKVLSLVLVMPLLSVFADILSVFGGMVMARLQLGLGFEAFAVRLGEAVSYRSFMLGIGKTPVFAAIIAIVGCYQGFKVQGSAESVGQRTTISVVQSIFLVIVTDAMFSVLFSMLGV
jgi:phospholipid/cholesterol/gamma-HCH transport system permease protein